MKVKLATEDNSFVSGIALDKVQKDIENTTVDTKDKWVVARGDEQYLKDNKELVEAFEKQNPGKKFATASYSEIQSFLKSKTGEKFAGKFEDGLKGFEDKAKYYYDYLAQHKSVQDYIFVADNIYSIMMEYKGDLEWNIKSDLEQVKSIENTEK